MYSLGSQEKQYVLKRFHSEFLNYTYANNSENLQRIRLPASRRPYYAMAQQAFIHIAVADSRYHSYFVEGCCRKVRGTICTFYLHHYRTCGYRFNGILQ